MRNMKRGKGYNQDAGLVRKNKTNETITKTSASTATWAARMPSKKKITFVVITGVRKSLKLYSKNMKEIYFRSS